MCVQYIYIYIYKYVHEAQTMHLNMSFGHFFGGGVWLVCEGPARCEGLRWRLVVRWCCDVVYKYIHIKKKKNIPRLRCEV
jgi:hypothetical protein